LVTTTALTTGRACEAAGNKRPAANTARAQRGCHLDPKNLPAEVESILFELQASNLLAGREGVCA
jgi:hypothetical protein